MAIWTLAGSGSSTSTGSGRLDILMIFTGGADGSSVSTGTGLLTLITAFHVGQAGLGVDADAEERRVGQAGLGADAETDERRVGQAGLGVDADAEERRVTQTGLGVEGSGILRRVTQAGLQVDARYRRVANLTDCWEVHIEDMIGTHLGVLDNAFDVGIQDILSDTGGGRLAVHADDPDAALLAPWRRCKIRYRDVDVFTFYIENINTDLVSEGEEASKIHQVSGRGLLGTLEKVLVYPSNILDYTTVNRPFVAQKWAEIWSTLYAEATVRGAGDLTASFGNINDTDGNPWVDSNNLSFKAGQTMLQVIRQLTAFGMEVIARPDGTLDGYLASGAGADISATMWFRYGQNCTAVSFGRKVGDQATVVLGEGQGILDEDVDAGAVVNWGRREGHLPVHNTSLAAQLANANAIFINSKAEPIDSYTLSVKIDDTHRPFIDYTLGDMIHLSVPGTIDADFRIVGIGMNERTGPCDLTVTLTVNTLELEYLLKLDKAFRASAAALSTSAVSSDLPYGDPRGAIVEGMGIAEHDIVDLEHDAIKIQGIDVDDAAIGEGKVLVYRTAVGDLVYEVQGLSAKQDMWPYEAHIY